MKKCWNGVMLFCILLLAAPVMAMASEKFTLLENGNVKCCIVVGKNASIPEKYAAEELAAFLQKVGKSKTAPQVVSAPVKGLYPITLSLTKNPAVKDEGYELKATGKGLKISGKKPVGVLYGVYGFLRDHAEVYFLAPGDEYTYYPYKKVFSIPAISQVKNPAFHLYRDIGRVSMGWKSTVKDTWKWSARNFLRITSNMEVIKHKPNTKILTENGVRTSAGGHWMAHLLYGDWLDKRSRKESKAYKEKMFKEHPEYYPMRNGKRVPLNGRNQPCTTNPEVIDIFVKNIIRWQDPSRCTEDAIFSIGNDDGTQWCQCPNCKKIDPPEETKKGLVSTRYWTFANTLLDRVLKEKPDTKLEAWTYQNFSLPPLGVKPDKRFHMLMLSNHRRCWRHALDDKNCPTNVWYYKYNKDWNDTGIKGMCYEMLSAAAGRYFMPLEKSVVRLLKYYMKNMKNIRGFHTELPPPDGNYNPRRRHPATLTCWYRMWQTVYMAYACAWDPEQDFDALNEKINSLYYGKGWEGGMKQFRSLLTELFEKGSGCWGYGNTGSGSIGKLLEVPGAKEKLLQYLAAAEKAASLDPDKRSLKHVRQAKEFFNVTWLEAAKTFAESFQDVKAFERLGKITIDGRLTEKDWANAETYARFTAFSQRDPKIKYPTSVKITYDAENIYIGIECLESAKKKDLVTNITKKDGAIWNDNDIEIFINNPILGSSYFHLLFNVNGVLHDAYCTSPRNRDVSFSSGAIAKTSFADGKYFMEIKIPVRPITGSTLQAGEILKMNIMRCRRTLDQKENETSLWAPGFPWNAENSHAVNFSGKRAVNRGSRRELDTRLWKNGSFNEVDKKPRIAKHWKTNGKKPAFWGLSGAKQYGGDMEMLLHKNQKNNYFVRLRKGFIFQSYGIKTKKIRASLRMRGKGSFILMILRYKNWRPAGSKRITKVDVNSTDWKPYSIEFDRPGDISEQQSFVIWPAANSEVDIDDCYLVPR